MDLPTKYWELPDHFSKQFLNNDGTQFYPIIIIIEENIYKNPAFVWR